MMPYLSCKKIENDVYNFPTWQYCKYKDIFDSRIIINSTAKFYISISYHKDLLSIDTRIFTPSLLMMILAVIIALVIIFCGFMLIYTVYFRFLKILVVVPFGALAFSTVSGNRMVSHSAVSYAKYFLSIVLEAVTMALAIIVCNAFLNAGLPTFTSDYADWTKALMYMCELTFSVAMTVGAVKGAQGLTKAQFATIEASMFRSFAELGSKLTPLTGNERLVL